MSRILFVDDSSDFRDPIAAALQRRGFQGTTAWGGREALPLLRSSTFHLVILDLLMPDVNGMAVLRSLRNEVGLGSLQVILLTGRDSEAAMMEARSLGAQCLLKYCITVNELCTKVKNMLASAVAV